MEIGWRVEKWVGRGSQEQLPRASTEERGERVGEKRRKKEEGRERESDDHGNEKKKRKIKQWVGYNFLIEWRATVTFHLWRVTVAIWKYEE